MAQPPAQKRSSLGLEPFLGETKLGPPSQMGEEANIGELGPPGQREYHCKHPTWFSTEIGTTPTRIDLQKHNSRIICSIRT